MNAHGTTLTYAPQSVSVSMIPGSAQVIPLTVMMGTAPVMSFGAEESTFSLTVIAGNYGGNLPMEWVLPLAPVVDISPSMPAVPMIMVSVPEGTEPGTYSSQLFSMVMGGTEPVDPGQGVLLSITVPDMTPACEETPVFDDTSIGPTVIDVPNNKPLDIQVEGTATVAEGCTLTRVRYEIDDEYGEDSDGDITFADNGNFNVTIPVTASRKGSDKDGRLYQLKLFAENEAGEGESSVFLIRISHDQSKK